MIHNLLKASILAGVLLGLPDIGYGQITNALWQKVPAPDALRATTPTGQWYTLDATQLRSRLAQAPPETRPQEAVPLELPYPDGTLHRFAITQVPVMAPALAARYPQIQAYAGRGIDEPAATVRLEWLATGLHAQVTTPQGVLAIGTEAQAPGRYQSRQQTPTDFNCQAIELTGNDARPMGGTPPTAPAPYGTQLRTLRLALAATGEYVQSLGGGSVAGTLASMVTLVNSINAVYERDLSMRLQLVADTDKLIYLDANSDPYDNSSPSALMNANDAVVNNALGAGTYDIGHVLGYRSGGYSGVAYVGVVCSSTRPAGGSSTGASAALMATVVTHEIGHQLGSGHTFNGDKGNCAGGNRSANLAYEPGAGNTIMSYDSRCAPDNVGSAVRYFHAGSISAIWGRLRCGTLSANGNSAPSVSVPPSGYVIPKGTPFTLEGSGSDPDGDALGYSWEQLDLGEPSGLDGAATDASGPPLFRSYAPQASPARTFPNMAAVLSGSSSLGEILPLVARTLNFRLTARDNRGGVAAANTALTVADAGPFSVTAPNTALTLAPGSTYTLSWDVLGTDQAPVNCTNVQVLFSADGGTTFPTVLLASTPNDGSAEIQLPRLNTTKGRLKIQAVNNVFFAVNNANITLAGTLPVELTAFRAEARGAVAHLSWTTALERNNQGFAVEAAPDGINFRRIAWVPGRGNSTVTTSYHYADNGLSGYGATTVYYRLRQIDQDGTEIVSPAQIVVITPDATSGLQLWPNPVHERVTVSGPAPGQLLYLLDLAGREVLRTTLPASGTLELRLPAGLPQGVYMVRNGAASGRLIVQ
ncbi:reprolysin-like metallopeptidase [Solirubrum puertoriconensis]|uniref:reprolysin-like metallopeptidase n=1 Tax=Solirubrum puertoriconensis TaxID=1751427 RepID=UPI00098EE9EA|nr:zinc-dependent metalloprotease family protein [Solirubrum puertoriconensis]